jgi:hypothetical protein
VKPEIHAADREHILFLCTHNVVFTIATTATYVALCVTSSAAAERVHLGPLERYGEVLSGAFIAVVGVVFLFWA